MVDLNSQGQFSARVNWHIDAGMRKHAEPLRTYLGVSAIGEACERSIQISLMAAQKQEASFMPEPRLMRIFQRGHVAEASVATWLRQAGFVLVTEDPLDWGQFEVRFLNGRLRGHTDGLLCAWHGEGACPLELPALWECKCLGASWWKKAAKSRLKLVFPRYYGQMQLYMHGLNLKQGLFTCLNADTQELHHERIPYDADEAALLLSRAERVLAAQDAGELLPRAESTPASLTCKLCRATALCWGDNREPCD